MSRWSSSRDVEKFSEKLPHTPYEIANFLDNAFWHLRNVDISSTVDARYIINNCSIMVNSEGK